MMVKVFIIMIELGSWEECRKFADDHGISMQDTYALCVPYEYEAPLATETSPRPRSRSDQ